MKEIKELQKQIIDILGTEDIEDTGILCEIDGVKYGLDIEEELSCVDEGKYQYGGNIYKVGLLNDDKGYGIKGEPLFYIRQNFTKTGSYYSDFYYEYEQPYITTKEEVVTYEWQ